MYRVHRLPGSGVCGRLHFVVVCIALDDESAEFARLRKSNRGSGEHQRLIDRRDVALRQSEIVDPDRTLAAAACRDHDLDRRDVMRLAPAQRPPGEFEMPLLENDARPVVRENEIALVDPPDVVA